MVSNPVQREHDFIAWIESQRRDQQPFFVPLEDEQPRSPAATEIEPASLAYGDGWARRMPDGLLIAAAVLGACIGCPIGSATGGVAVGFLCAVAGALLGELLVLAIAGLLKLALRGIMQGIGMATAMLHSRAR
ncbi:MAG: hypothetical protein ACLGXA_04260 [Acidobacteriota bacterium]